ncbi:MAG: PKD domain-containing protein, partial [Planctomycetes bacterium]|nr:PKD domain-containing protein [Planctomycetota bacterium]
DMPVIYSTSFPDTLIGFDAAFLSFGNYGGSYTRFNGNMASIVQAYLENGGRVYLEGGESLGYNQPNNAELLNLFGLASANDGTASNPLDNLSGQTGALTEGMVFTETNQVNQAWIDRYFCNNYGQIAFYESSYGNVAVQNEGEFGQKTFCFSYSLADLVDNNPLSTRHNLLSKILGFFDQPHLLPNFEADVTTGQYELTVQFNDLSIGYPPITSWTWDFDNDGSIDSGEQNPTWTYSEIGSYSVRLVVANDVGSDEIVLENYINVLADETALFFDGGSGHGSCQATPGLSLSEAMTIEAW